MEQEIPYSGAILNDHGRGIQIWDAPNFLFPYGNSFMKFCSFYRTEKAIIEGKFEIHWWVHRRGRYIKTEEELLYGPETLSDFRTGGNWRSVMSIVVKILKGLLFINHGMLVLTQLGARNGCSGGLE